MTELTLQGSVLSSGSLRFQCLLLNPEMCCGQCKVSMEAAVVLGDVQFPSDCSWRVGSAQGSSWSFCSIRQNNAVTGLQTNTRRNLHKPMPLKSHQAFLKRMNKELHGEFLPVFKLWCAPTTLHVSMRPYCWCSHVDCDVQLSPWLRGSSSSRWSLILFPNPHRSLLSSLSGFFSRPTLLYLLLRRPSSLFP